MRPTPEMKEQTAAELQRCIDVINRVYKKSFTAPEARWDVTGTRGGYVNQGEWLVHLNPTLLGANPQNLKATTAHELMHLIDGQLSPDTRERQILGFSHTARGGLKVHKTKRSIHGPTWKSLMELVGHRAKRCHSMDTSHVPRKRRIRYKYLCKCGFEGQIGPKHHKHIQLGGNGVYFHRCGPTHTLSRDGFKGRVELQPRQMRAPQLQPDQPAPKVPSPQPKTKLDQAISMVRTYPSNTTRSEFIRLFMQNLGMSKAGAGTYYYTAKKYIEKERR